MHVCNPNQACTTPSPKISFCLNESGMGSNHLKFIIRIFQKISRVHQTPSQGDWLPWQSWQSLGSGRKSPVIRGQDAPLAFPLPVNISIDSMHHKSIIQCITFQYRFLPTQLHQFGKSANRSPCAWIQTDAWIPKSWAFGCTFSYARYFFPGLDPQTQSLMNGEVDWSFR